MPDIAIKILFAFAMLSAVFYGGLFVWELLCKFLPEMKDMSILFEKGEER